MIYSLNSLNLYLDMFFSFRKNIDRRRERFGYESVSKMGIDVAGAAVFQVNIDVVVYCIPGKYRCRRLLYSR